MPLASSVTSKWRAKYHVCPRASAEVVVKIDARRPGGLVLALAFRDKIRSPYQEAPVTKAATAPKNRNELRFAVIALAVIVLLLWDQPTGRVVLLLTVVTLLFLAAISVVARGVPSPDEDESETGARPSDATV